MALDLAAERAYWRHKCKDSFWWFFKYAYGYDFNPQGGGGGRKWLREETHKDACDWFEGLIKPWLAARRAGNGYPLRLAIIVPRDWGKTTLFTQAGLLWLHLHDPDISTFIDSENAEKSSRWLAPPLKVLSGEDEFSRFAWLYGSGFSTQRVWKKSEVVTAFRNNLTKTEKSFAVLGVESGATGAHPDAVSLDDPTSYEKIKQDAMWLDKVNAHRVDLIPVLQQDGLLMCPGTRYGDEDHFGYVLKREGVKSISGRTIADDGKPYVADLPDYDVTPEGRWHVYYLSGEEPVTKRLTMPHIWPRWRIDELDAADPLKCAAQVRNDPTTSSLTPITVDEVARCVRGKLKDYDWKRMYITLHMDTAFKKPGRQGTGDETVLEAWGHLRDQSGKLVYWGGWGDNKMTGDKLRDLVYETVMNLRNAGCYVRCLTDEPEAGGKSNIWQMFLHSKFAENKQVMPEFIYLPRSQNPDAKYKRMCEAAGYWKQGYVILPEDAPGLDKLCYQMARIGTSKRKDWADVASDPFHALVYEAIQYLPEQTERLFIDNPFDGILKPGLEGLEAAERVAKFYEDLEKVEMLTDPIS